MRVLAACGNGMGSSTIIKLKIEKVLKKLGVEAQIDHSNTAMAAHATGYDVIVVTSSFVSVLKDQQAKGVIVIGLQNLMSEQELEEKFLVAGIGKKA